MPRSEIADLAARLGSEAEAVCHAYLSAGRRVGRYWIVGDVRNAAGRSMFVRLSGPARGPGAVGRWRDAATGEHGDLLDVIREALGLAGVRDAAEEARQFLGLPREPVPVRQVRDRQTSFVDSADAARRLFTASRPVAGTLAETYLRRRCIPISPGLDALHFHPRCFYREDKRGPLLPLPALVAAVTDLAGRQTGAHRTRLAPTGRGKARVATPRRAMGELLGHGVRFGVAGEVLAVGEGIETVLSLRAALQDLPMLAALSAGHLAAVRFPEALRRLYIVQDRDPAGEAAVEALATRGSSAGIEVVALVPVQGDLNDDLRAFGLGALREAVRAQLHPGDAERFLGR